MHSVSCKFKNLKYVFIIDQLKIVYYAEVESRPRYNKCGWGFCN